MPATFQKVWSVKLKNENFRVYIQSSLIAHFLIVTDFDPWSFGLKKEIQDDRWQQGSVCIWPRRALEMWKKIGVGVKAMLKCAMGHQLGWRMVHIMLDISTHYIEFANCCGDAAVQCPACGPKKQPAGDRLRPSGRHLNVFHFRAHFTAISHASGVIAAARPPVRPPYELNRERASQPRSRP